MADCQLKDVAAPLKLQARILTFQDSSRPDTCHSCERYLRNINIVFCEHSTRNNQFHSLVIGNILLVISNNRLQTEALIQEPTCEIS